MNVTDVVADIASASVIEALDKNLQAIANVNTLQDKSNGVASGVVRPLKRHFHGSTRSAKSSDSDFSATKYHHTSGGTETSQKIKKRFVAASKKLRSEHEEHLQKAEDAEKRKRDLENLSRAIREKNSRRGSFGRKITNPVAPQFSNLGRSGVANERKSVEKKDAMHKKQSVSISEIFRKPAPSPQATTPAFSKPSDSAAAFLEQKKYCPEEIKAYIELKKVKLAKQKRQERKQHEEMRRHRNDQIKLAEEFHKKGAVAYRRMLERRKKRSRPSTMPEMDVSDDIDICNPPVSAEANDLEPDCLPQKVLVTDGTNHNNPTLDEESQEIADRSTIEEIDHRDEQNRLTDRIRKIKESAGRLVLRVSKYTEDKPCINTVSTTQSSACRASENQPFVLNTYKRESDTLPQTEDISMHSSHQSIRVPDPIPFNEAFCSTQDVPVAGEFSIKTQQDCFDAIKRKSSEIENASDCSEGIQDIDSICSAPTTFETIPDEKERIVKVDWNIFGKPAPQFRPNPLSIINVFAARLLDRKEEIVLDGEREDSFIIPRPPAESRNAIRAFSRSPKLRFIPPESQPGSSLEQNHHECAQCHLETNHSEDNLSVIQTRSTAQNHKKKRYCLSESDYTPTDDGINDTGITTDDDPSERMSSAYSNCDQSEGHEENITRLSPRSLALQATATLRYLDEMYEAKAEIRELECTYKIQTSSDVAHVNNSNLQELSEAPEIATEPGKTQHGFQCIGCTDFSERDNDLNASRDENACKVQVSIDEFPVTAHEFKPSSCEDQNMHIEELSKSGSFHSFVEHQAEQASFRNASHLASQELADKSHYSESLSDDPIRSMSDSEQVCKQESFLKQTSPRSRTSSGDELSSYGSDETNRAILKFNATQLENVYINSGLDNPRIDQDAGDMDMVSSKRHPQPNGRSDAGLSSENKIVSQISPQLSERDSNAICTEIESMSNSTLSIPRYANLHQNSSPGEMINVHSKSLPRSDGTGSIFSASETVEFFPRSADDLDTFSDHFQQGSGEISAVSTNVSNRPNSDGDRFRNAENSSVDSDSHYYSSFDTENTVSKTPIIPTFVDSSLTEIARVTIEGQIDEESSILNRDVFSKGLQSLATFQNQNEDAPAQSTPVSFSDSCIKEDSCTPEQKFNCSTDVSSYISSGGDTDYRSNNSQAEMMVEISEGHTNHTSEEDVAEQILEVASEIQDLSLALFPKPYVEEKASSILEPGLQAKAKETECGTQLSAFSSPLNDSSTYSDVNISQDRDASAGHQFHFKNLDSESEVCSDQELQVLSNRMPSEVSNAAPSSKEMHENITTDIEDAQNSYTQDYPAIHGNSNPYSVAPPNPNHQHHDTCINDLDDNNRNAKNYLPNGSDIDDTFESSSLTQADVSLSAEASIPKIEEQPTSSSSSQSNEPKTQFEIADLITKSVFDDLIKEFEFLDFRDVPVPEEQYIYPNSLLCQEATPQVEISEEGSEPKRVTALTEEKSESLYVDQVTTAILDDLVTELQHSVDSREPPEQQMDLPIALSSQISVVIRPSSESDPLEVRAGINYSESPDQNMASADLESKSERTEQITNAILSDLVKELQISVNTKLDQNAQVPFDVNDPECAKIYISTILNSQGSIEWENPFIRNDIFEELENQLEQKDSTVSSFRKFVFEMLQSVVLSMRPFGENSVPESWHHMRPRKLSTRFWRQPSQTEIITEVVSRIFPDPSSLYDNVDEIVNSQVRKEEWFFDEHVADVQFEIADAIFSDILQDSIQEIVRL